MDEQEFKNQIATIEMIKNQIGPLKQELLGELNNTFASSVSTLVSLMNERDKKFAEYLDSLKEFNFDNNLTTPSELFSGIRTISDTVDPDELQKKTDAMKANALDIESKNKEIESISNHVISALKRSIGTLSELMIQENQIYDMNIDILSDLDSIYDIGQIASATK